MRPQITGDCPERFHAATVDWYSETKGYGFMLVYGEQRYFHAGGFRFYRVDCDGLVEELERRMRRGRYIVDPIPRKGDKYYVMLGDNEKGEEFCRYWVPAKTYMAERARLMDAFAKATAEYEALPEYRIELFEALVDPDNLEAPPTLGTPSIIYQGRDRQGWLDALHPIWDNEHNRVRVTNLTTDQVISVVELTCPEGAAYDYVPS